MFNRMISHFAGETPKSRQAKANDISLNSGYVRQLRRTYADVYSK